MRKSRVLAFAPALLAALGLGSFTSDAAACGGLFCSSSNPVNQAAERIVFAKNEDGTVTAAIEILYEGPSESFAWLLPVPPAELTVGVSSKQALDALQQASNPLYGFTTSFVEGCQFDSASGSPVNAPAVPGAVPSPEDGASPVEVVASGSVGPYDYVQIEVNPDDADPAQAAVDWLEESGYDVGSVGPEVLRPYLMQEMNLLAFRLSKNSETGSIRPVMITYPGERPLIPIKPTAVAANDDMGILVWVLGEGRAVPTTYLHLELNEARIDWFNPNPTYNQVIIEAADEAGGNGFVTEQSGPAEGFVETVFPQWKEDQFTQLRTAQFGSIEEFLQMAQSVAASHFYPQFSGFGGPLGDSALGYGQNQYDGFIEVLSDPEVVPLREGATPEQLNACVSCYFQVDVAVRNDLYPSTPYDPATDPILNMDVGLFLDKMDELVVGPMRETSELFAQNRQVTRLYTTMSANEMTIDPEFDLNAELEDVSNVHTAERIFECNGNDWTIRLPQGTELTGAGTTWPITLEETEMPFNLRILQLSTSGEGDVLLDNTDRVLSRLTDLGLSDVGPEQPTPADPDEVPIGDPSTPGEPEATAEPSDEGPAMDGGDDEASDPNLDEATPARTSSDEGCAVRAPASGRGAAFAWLSLATLALVGLRRRR